MTFEQSAYIVKVLHDAYYAQDRYAKREELMSRTELYNVYFADMPFRIVSQEVREWVKSNREMPTINELLTRCKDSLSLEQNPLGDVSELKPTWWYIREANGYDMNKIKPEAAFMVDKFIKWLKTPPKRNNNNLPYER